MYVLGIVALFLMAAGLDRLAGPLFTPPGQSHKAGPADPSNQPDQPAGHTVTHTPTAAATASASTGPAVHDHKLTPERGLPWIPGGLQIAEEGYGLLLTGTPAKAGRQGTLAFQITGPDGRPVTAYTPTHEKPLHLIVVRRDLTSYQHVHPVLSANGTWRTPMTFEQPGTYRVLADFLPRGRDEPLTLGADLIVPGHQEPAQRLVESRTNTVDGYTTQVRGDLKPGRLGRLTFTVGRNGEPVRDLQPYLGAYGHVVALRSGDLAYLHVHPAGTPGDGRTAAGPTIAFDVEVPSAGTYRLFLDFQHRGAVRTAVFTLTATR
jgi:hypothetical protein